MATAAAHHAMTAGSIILLDVTRGVDGLDPITRLTPDALFPESEVPVAKLGPGRLARAGRRAAGAAAAPSRQVRWPGHCYRTPYPALRDVLPRRLQLRRADRRAGRRTRPDMFGLYLVDAFGNKELLYRDPEISSLWPVPLRPRARPPVLPSPPRADRRRRGDLLRPGRLRALARRFRPGP